MPSFEATRGLFWDEPRNFESRSDDEDDTRAGTPSPSFRTIPAEGRFALAYDLTCSRPPCTSDLQWDMVLNLEPSTPEAKNLPPFHRGPNV
ncbi:hypothetical protein AVEN_152536-1 [Araneus ventricosus]|uniref:Uncharacterized protein n=1 Tax=Araneus ventricosus TaxID=182803 RepID=A0A4Y2VCP3_ARAVE|nr:hypothetical protein AVEN_152536-1 [Araneus ventricosus]